MTLIVSLRIPDGIVIAGDSLATVPQNIEIAANIGVTCPNCGHQHNVPTKIQAAGLPATTFSYAQKVFPFMGKYGVGTFGLGQVAGKTSYFAIRQLEKQLLDEKKAFEDVNEVAEVIGAHAQDLLKKQVESEKADWNGLPDNWRPAGNFGFQVVGYDDEQALTIELIIGKQVQKQAFSDPGCAVSGDKDVVVALWGMNKQHPERSPIYQVFSLQDAIAYAEFLISTTASHQQFSRTIAGVGGEIDIALITPFDEFTWIRQKSLMDTIMRKNHEQKESTYT